MVAPDGTLVNQTLCGAVLSWSSNVTVLFTPTTRVNVDGSKFSDWLVPIPWGMITVAPLTDDVVVVLLTEVVEVVVVVEEDVGGVVEVVVLLVVVVVELGAKMK